MSNAAFSVRDLELSTRQQIPDFDIYPGCNLLHVSRESSATVLALTLAGRMRARSGGITGLGHKQAFRQVALAGATEIDSLERLVPAWTVVREQLAWSQPWYRLTPRDVDRVDSVQDAFAAVGLDYTNAQLKEVAVGKMPVLDRLRLRVALALIARPAARLVVVDDIDQLRSNRLRGQFLESLSQLSQTLPVVAVSANGAQDGQVDHIVRITGEE